jgi:hypothetical protein
MPAPGIKQDLKRAKEAAQAGEKHGQLGHGVGWSHNFLNQVPLLRRGA